MEALRDHIRLLGEPTVGAPSAPPPTSTSARAARPISFNDEMIRALLTGRKNQTRRLSRGEQRCPFGAPGDLLWVRERWARNRDGFVYAVDSIGQRVRFHAPFTMPRAACRALLRILELELEPVQSITAPDARGEGYDERATTLPPRRWFAHLWDRIYADPGSRWIENPTVWVVRFELLRIDDARS